MDKSILIQKQIRDNADELQRFMRDLTNWEKEMKRKETQICGEVPQDVPPIRKKTKVSEIRSENVLPSSANSESKFKKISGFDYQAWEKLDVTLSRDISVAKVVQDFISSQFDE